MRALAMVLTVLACASGVWAMIAAYRMGAWLSRQGVRVNWFLYRALMPWYVQRYKKMTEEREGEPGSLYRQFLVTINLALVLGVAAVIASRVARG